MNKKGFTMVELLVAMAIMGLLIIMAFPTIRAIQSNNTSTKYKEYGKSVISAAKLYTDSYQDDLFDLNDNNGMTSIDLNELVKKDLLKDINISDSTCLNGSSVNIIKYKDDYTYCLNLICSTGGKEVYTELSKEGKCKDLTLYKVTYSYGSTKHDVSVIQGNNHSVLTPGAAHISIPNGYRFVQWNSGAGDKKPGEVIEVNSDITFTPELEAFNYTIRFKSSLDPPVVTGTQSCTVGQSCKLKVNEYVKDYYTFDGYKYNNKDYSVGSEMKNVFSITEDNQIVDVTAKFKQNMITVNYYSNGGILRPNPSQSCPVQAGCKPADHCSAGTDECRNKEDLVKTINKDSKDTGYSASGKGMPNYDTTTGASLYMTRSGCTGTHFWHIGSPTSSNKINEDHNYTDTVSTFKTMADFANDSRVGKGEAFKKGNVTVNVYAGWDCPNSITCDPGTYLPKSKSKCVTCTEKNYCEGGVFIKNNKKDQGIKPCPDGYKNSPKGSKRITQCYMKVKVDHYVKKERDKDSTLCARGYTRTAHEVKYEKVSKCNIVSVKCSAGYYLPKDKLTCSICTKGNYCKGGTYKYNESNDQGITACPGSYKNGGTGAKKEGDCVLNVAARYHVATAKKGAVICPNMYGTTAHSVKYGNISNCKMNTITLKYYENGGRLTPGRVQRCMKKACAYFKNDPLCKCNGNYVSNITINNGKLCINYARCDLESGAALVTDNVLDTQFYTDGVRNYSGYYGATIYMTRSGCTATGDWHVGSKNSSKVINENTPYPDQESYLKNGFGESYWNDYQTKNITIKLYAGWRC